MFVGASYLANIRVRLRVRVRGRVRVRVRVRVRLRLRLRGGRGVPHVVCWRRVDRHHPLAGGGALWPYLLVPSAAAAVHGLSKAHGSHV